MAIETVTTIDVMVGGVKVDEFGVSDTLDNYTDAEISDYIYVGANSRMLGGNIDLYANNAGSYDTWQDGMPFNTGSVTGSIMTMQSGDGSYECPASGRYLGIVLLHASNGTYNDYITVTSADNYVMITEFDAKKFLLDINATLTQIDNTGATSFTDKTNTLYNPELSSVSFKYNNAGTYIDTAYGVVPYFVLNYGGYLYLISAFKVNQTAIFRCSFRTAPAWNAGTVYYPFSYNDISKSISIAFNGYGFGDHISAISPDDYIWPYGGAGPYYKYSNSDYIIMRTNFGGAGFTCEYYYINYNDMMMMYANSGMYFRINGDTVYKPLIDSNVVYGFTDNLDTESDIDNYDGSTKHDIPVTPPTPPTPPPGPYDDDPWSGATFSGVGVGGAGAFAKCYYMTSTELANLRSWMNSINVPEGFDPMQQIIGLSQVPVALSGSGPENVVFVNSSAVYDPGVTTRAVDTGVATQQAMGTPISYYLGSVDIVRRMQERGEPYLDYDCQIELYLPLIGMFSLDTQAVMGRTISAYAILDPVSGTLAAYAYVSKDGQNLPVAYGSTTIGVDLPVSAQQLSVSRAALKQANAQLGASLLSGALTMLAAASSGKASGTGAKTSTGSSGLSAAGIREAGSDYMKASQVGNVFGDFMNWGRTIRQLSYGNNTAVSGSFGGSTAQWAYPFTPYVKIIRPRFEKPSNYAHSQGVPCVQTKTIGSCTGFVQCIGVDVSGITGATDLELQAIQAALSNGIFAGGGQ